MRHIGVIGAGAWGTALAIVAAAGGPVTLWARRPELAASIGATRGNPDYLPGAVLPAEVAVSADLGALGGCDALVAVVPAQHLAGVLTAAPVGDKPLLICAKGIEAGSARLPSETAAMLAPGAAIGALSGPTFAAEVAAGLPTAVTLACADRALGEAWLARLARPAFRPYWSEDVIGAEIGGAVKNVLAIACGAVIGRGLGENARAATLSRGFAEMMRYGLARGAQAMTLTGLSGLGDLVLTCASGQSRNYRLGLALGAGRSAAEALSGSRSVAEGAATAPVLAQHAAELRVEMPIVDAVAKLVRGEAAIDSVVERLLARPLREEAQPLAAASEQQ